MHTPLPKGISKMWECCLGALLHIARLEKDASSLFSLYWRRSWWPLLSWPSAMHRCSGKGRNLTVFLTRLRGRKPFAFGRVVTISCHSTAWIHVFSPRQIARNPKVLGENLLAKRYLNLLEPETWGRTVPRRCSKYRWTRPEQACELSRKFEAIPVYRKCSQNHWYRKQCRSPWEKMADFCKARKAAIAPSSFWKGKEKTLAKCGGSKRRTATACLWDGLCCNHKAPRAIANIQTSLSTSAQTRRLFAESGKTHSSRFWRQTSIVFQSWHPFLLRRKATFKRAKTHSHRQSASFLRSVTARCNGISTVGKTSEAKEHQIEHTCTITLWGADPRAMDDFGDKHTSV